MDLRLRMILEVTRLAVKDFCFESRISICLILALMAVLAPMLILFGLKFGLIDTLAVRLIQDPRNREIVIATSGRLEESWFERWRPHPDVEFLIPNTRDLAASLAYVRNRNRNSTLQSLAMVPSGESDPILEDKSVYPRSYDEILLTESAAKELSVTAGDIVEARVLRRRRDVQESVSISLNVKAVLPHHLFPREAAFVTLDLLDSTEDYRDGYAVPLLNWPGEKKTNTKRIYPRFRLYARSIYAVQSLADALENEGLDIRTSAGEVVTMQLLDRNLSLLFWLIASIGTTGFLASLGANQLANVDRKVRELSVLRLLGVPTQAIVLFPLVQALLVGLGGVILAVFNYLTISFIINSFFAADLRKGETICRLLFQHFIVALAITLVFASFASFWAGRKAARIQPAEGLREV